MLASLIPNLTSIHSFTKIAGEPFYGGVRSCILEGDVLTIGFEPEAAAALGFDQECRLRLGVDAESVSRLHDGLRRVLSTAKDAPTELIL